MARRTRSNDRTLMIGLMALLLVLLLLGFQHFSRGKGAKSQLDLPELPVEEAMENANSLRDNRYQVTGVVQRKEVRAGGTLIVLRVERGGQLYFLPIKLEADFQTINIEREKSYQFAVLYAKGGVAVATSVQKQ